MITGEIINHAINYILEHIGEEITIEDVADYCHFSKYYFSRIFKEETGESLYAFIKRMKLEQSAFRLKVERGRTVTDIGYDYGYSPGNYSQVFKKHHKESPVEFRSHIVEKSVSHPYYPDTEVKLESFEECNSKVTIEEIEDRKVIYERRLGNYRELVEAWCEFKNKYEKYINEETLFLERTFDDPSITDADKCLYDICMSVPENMSGNRSESVPGECAETCKPENTCVIQGGKFAVYHYKGFPAQIYTAYQNMFNVWFPATNRRMDNRYGFEIYRRIDYDTMYMELDMYIPIE